MIMTDYSEILWKGRRDRPCLVRHLFVKECRVLYTVSQLDKRIRGELLRQP